MNDGNHTAGAALNYPDGDTLALTEICLFEIHVIWNDVVGRGMLVLSTEVVETLADKLLPVGERLSCLEINPANSTKGSPSGLGGNVFADQRSYNVRADLTALKDREIFTHYDVKERRK